MPKLIPPAKWEHYFELRDSMTMNQAADLAGINRSSAWRLEHQPGYKSSGRAAFLAWQERNPGGVPLQGGLSSPAKRALNDFAYFRLRYFGRKSTPWQIDAANRILAAHERARQTLDPQFVVINVAPGSGKSELFGHDIPAWLIARDRSITIFIGSASMDRAKDQTEELLTTLERTEPAEPSRKQRLRGAVNPLACMAGDYGRFKPDNKRNWAVGAFKVAQADGNAPVGKEATAAAVGRDSNYLGLRPDIVVWDDLVNEETSGTPEARERTQRKFQREAEPRVELGGVLILQGQRQFPDDLYNYCINQRGADENNPDSKKYEHIVYKAHYEEHCRGWHGKTAKPYNPADPEAGGCLIDPLGVSWNRLTEVRLADERDGTQYYRVVYQQEDGDPTRALVNPIWVDGGQDRASGEQFPGCWDDHRGTGYFPLTKNHLVTAISVDTSPTKYWACGLWAYDPVTERRYLIDLVRSRMKVTDALCRRDGGGWTGLFEDWWVHANSQGHPPSHIIIETVAAEKFFLESDTLTDWGIDRGVVRTKHDTKRNKTDSRYGVQMLGPLYRAGRVRLPGDVHSGSRAKIMPLIRELTRWPDGATEDCVMQQWFFEFKLPDIYRLPGDTPTMRVPSHVRAMPHRRLVAVGSR